MKRLLAIFFVCLYLTGRSQEHFSPLKQAEHFLDTREYLTAAKLYNSTFRQHGSSIRIHDRYNAACAWAMAKYPDSAFIQLNKILSRINVIGYDHMISDQDLFPLQTDPRWKPLLDSAKYYQEAADKKFNPALAKLLESILEKDQEDRKKIEETEKKFGMSSKELAALWETINKKDIVNRNVVSRILDSCGWLGREVIGEKANMTLFLVIQHADLKTQEKYLPVMREAMKNGNAGSAEFALLEDRVAIGQGKKQIYGSQVSRDEKTGKNVFLPIEDEAHVNARRASVGLGRIEEYATLFGIDYIAPGKEMIIVPAPHYSAWVPVIILCLTGIIVFLILGRYFRR